MDMKPGFETRVIESGQTIYFAGAPGNAWLLVGGSVRLDRCDMDGEMVGEMEGESAFAGLAIKGDVLGAETLLFGRYTFTATALTSCALVPWPGGQQAPEAASLLKVLADAERRGADAIALRYGEAAMRVRKLIQIIAASHPGQTLSRLMLPALNDMADITALTIGTVSRTLSLMQADGSLSSQERRRGRPKACK